MKFNEYILLMFWQNLNEVVIDVLSDLLRDIMEHNSLLDDNKYKLTVPVRVNFNVGKSWANMTSRK